MPLDAIIRIISLCIVLAGAETLLAGLICWWLVPPVGLQGAQAHRALGPLFITWARGNL